MAVYSDTSAMRRLRLRRLKRALISVFGVFLMITSGFAGYSFANSSFFDISEVAVTGNKAVDRESILALSGIRYGTNITRYSGSGISALLKTHPYIERAEVTRVFPRRIEIKISERVPMALVNSEDKHYLLDANGYCLAEVGIAVAESWSLPGIRRPSDAQRLFPGERATDPGTQAALSLIKQLDPYFLENIYEIDAPSAEKLSVLNREGLRVYFGQAEDLDRKLQNYEELLIKNAERCNADTLEYVDLRYNTQITLKWK